MKEQQKLDYPENKDAIYPEERQSLLMKDKWAENGIPLTEELRKKYRTKGAKFVSDLNKMSFTPGERLYVSENVSAKKWSNFRKGVVIGDYPFVVQINHGTSWSDVSYSKKDILIGKVRIER